jgi:hypothetical protein
VAAQRTISSDLRLAEAIMAFPIYAAMLSSQLIVLVADRVPEFDVGRSCSESSISDCSTLEKWAHEKLTESWSKYTAHDKAMCRMEEKMAGPPSYTGWLTCLDINANARRVDATKSGGSSSPGAGTSGETGPKRSAHRQRPRSGQP